jgi:hypothetical protein
MFQFLNLFSGRSIFLPSPLTCFLTGSWSPFSITRLLQPWRSCMLLQSGFRDVVQCRRSAICLTRLFLFSFSFIFPRYLFCFSARLPGHRYMPMIVCLNTLTRLFSFSFLPPIIFSAFQHDFRALVLAYDSLREYLNKTFCSVFPLLYSVELPPVSLIQVQVVFKLPVINKLFAITVEGCLRN